MCEVCVCVLVYMGTSLFYLEFSTVSSLQCIVLSINIFFICYREKKKRIELAMHSFFN